MELKIVDLTPENIDKFYPPESVQSFPPPIPVGAHDIRLAWVREMLTRGFRRKEAFNEAGQKLAHLEYMPIEEALDNVQGENVNFIHCVGEGASLEGGEPTRALLDVVERESFEQGRGVALSPWHMKDLLLEHGYRVIDEQKPYFLMLKAFAPNQRVWFIAERRTPQVELIEGKVVVDIFWDVFCSCCAYGICQLEWYRQMINEAVKEFGDLVIFREHQLNRAPFFHLDPGTTVLINGEEMTSLVRSLENVANKEQFIERIKKLVS
ncbi:hypothetical protein HYR99_15200 [Candidatus Poribacteria bacterium]|nr:hypothetical protein [Candidatus Poribacteria bacterium]